MLEKIAIWFQSSDECECHKLRNLKLEGSMYRRVDNRGMQGIMEMIEFKPKEAIKPLSQARALRVDGVLFLGCL